MTARTSGWVLVVSSLVGAVSAGGILGWPAEVSEGRYSYPFGPTSYVVSQVFFAVRDLATLAGLLGLTAALWSRADRLTRSGLVVAGVGMALFILAELFAVTARNAATVSAQADAVNAAYGPPMLVHGIGLVVAGIGLARSRLLPRTLGRWIVLATGVYLFVPVFPAAFASLVIGRLAIGSWLVVYAGIGLALSRLAAQPRQDREVALA